jgi:crotonobetainyl-CoA:carnitine CoA-transferase CaiB-like acyl-CoA transferase
MTQLGGLGKGALSGITVVDLSRLLPGPYCSMLLADHGARVICIEDKRFQAESFFPEDLYRNKEHMRLNLKSRRGGEVLERLVSGADVLLEGFRPGVAKRLGADYERLSSLNPGLVYCSLTGYGQQGEYSRRAGHDANYLGLSGVLDLIGEPDRPPSIPGVQLADIAGGLNAALGVMLALWAREKTGRGQYIDISLTDCAFNLLPLVLYLWREQGRAPKRGDHLLAHRFACYTTYETADGRALSVAALEPQFWKRLCEALDLTQYIDLQYDEARREEIIEAFRKAFAQRSLAQWEEALQDLDACCEPIRTVAEALGSPLFAERGMAVPCEEPGWPKTALGLPIRMSATPGGLRTPPARFGEHTEAVLLELGYSRSEVEEMLENGEV